MSSATAQSYKLYEYTVGEQEPKLMSGVVVLSTDTITVYYSSIVVSILIDKVISTKLNKLVDSTLFVVSEMMVRSIITNRQNGKVNKTTESCVLYIVGEDVARLVLRGTSEEHFDDLEFIFDAMPLGHEHYPAKPEPELAPETPKAKPEQKPLTPAQKQRQSNTIKNT
jgi:hypothetical protein